MIIKVKEKRAIELILCAISLPNVVLEVVYKNIKWHPDRYQELRLLLNEDLKNLY